MSFSTYLLICPEKAIEEYLASRKPIDPWICLWYIEIILVSQKLSYMENWLNWKWVSCFFSHFLGFFFLKCIWCFCNSLISFCLYITFAQVRAISVLSKNIWSGAWWRTSLSWIWWAAQVSHARSIHWDRSFTSSRGILMICCYSKFLSGFTISSFIWFDPNI